MPDFNKGIKTNAGIDLFNRIDSGETKIKYTKIVFSSLDLSEATDDQIEQMTDIQPQELSAVPQVVLKPKTSSSNQETAISARVDNKSLTNGFFVNTYGLYAEDEDDNKILYGVAVDNHPSYLPSYDGVRPQELTYEWDTTISDTDDIHFTDTHNAYTTWADFKDAINDTNRNIKVVFDQANTDINNNTASISSLETNQGSLASQFANASNTANSAMASGHDYTNSAYTTNSRRISAVLDQLGTNNQSTNNTVDSLISNVSSAIGLANQAQTNATSLAMGNANNISNNLIKLVTALNQLGTNNQATENAMDSLTSNVSNASSTATQANNNATSLANGNAQDIEKKFTALMTAFNQLGTENAQLKAELLN